MTDPTLIVLLVDRSTSMNRIRQETLDSVNKFMEQQKAVPGEAILFLAVFDGVLGSILDNSSAGMVGGRSAANYSKGVTSYKILREFENLKTVQPLDDTEYVPQNWTALYDSIGFTIAVIDEHLQEHPNMHGKILFSILTDGQENSSRAFSLHAVRTQINQKTSEGWEFLFLGANIDSATIATSMNISTDNTYDFAASSKGIENTFSGLNMYYSNTRTGKTVNRDDITKIIDKDNS